MFVQGFGEVLTDIMTVNPAFAELPSASSILDTSNYTFQAVTFGKDAEGFIHHAHAVSTTQYVNGDPVSGASGYDSGILTVINYGSDIASGASSYIVSSTYTQFSSTYNSMPNDPSPLDTRLERGSTLSTNLSSYIYASALPDLGHYVNAILDSQLSSIWNKVGAFAPSSGYEVNLYDKDKSFVLSIDVSGNFNTSGLMDKYGYLTVSPSSVTNSPDYTQGACLVSSLVAHPSEGALFLNISVAGGDALTLSFFGSIKHIGVYCLDLSEMLSSGLTPPFTWSALNNNRKYKLVAKSTILDDPLQFKDIPAFPPEGRAGVGWRSQPTLLRLIFNFK